MRSAGVRRSSDTQRDALGEERWDYSAAFVFSCVKISTFTGWSGGKRRKLEYAEKQPNYCSTRRWLLRGGTARLIVAALQHRLSFVKFHLLVNKVREAPKIKEEVRRRGTRRAPKAASARAVAATISAPVGVRNTSRAQDGEGAGVRRSTASTKNATLMRADGLETSLV